MASGHITSCQTDGETVEKQCQPLFLEAPKSLQMVTAAMKLKDLLLGRKVMTNLDSILGEGNGTPLQYSCLGNPMDEEA